MVPGERQAGKPLKNGSTILATVLFAFVWTAIICSVVFGAPAFGAEPHSETTEATHEDSAGDALHIDYLTVGIPAFPSPVGLSFRVAMLNWGPWRWTPLEITGHATGWLDKMTDHATGATGFAGTTIGYRMSRSPGGSVGHYAFFGAGLGERGPFIPIFCSRYSRGPGFPVGYEFVHRFGSVRQFLWGMRAYALIIAHIHSYNDPAGCEVESFGQYWFNPVVDAYIGF